MTSTKIIFLDLIIELLSIRHTGAKVIAACRDIQKTQAAIDDIKESTKELQNVGSFVIQELDLSSFESVRKCAERILQTEPSIHLLVDNAGMIIKNIKLASLCFTLTNDFFKFFILPDDCLAVSVPFLYVKITFFSLSFYYKNYSQRCSSKIYKTNISENENGVREILRYINNI